MDVYTYILLNLFGSFKLVYSKMLYQKVFIFSLTM